VGGIEIGLLIEGHDGRQDGSAAALALAFDGIGELVTRDPRGPAGAGGLRIVTMPTDKPPTATKSVAKLPGKPFVTAVEESDFRNFHALKNLDPRARSGPGGGRKGSSLGSHYRDLESFRSAKP
jgi:hypothetical protein